MEYGRKQKRNDKLNQMFLCTFETTKCRKCLEINRRKRGMKNRKELRNRDYAIGNALKGSVWTTPDTRTHARCACHLELDNGVPISTAYSLNRFVFKFITTTRNPGRLCSNLHAVRFTLLLRILFHFMYEYDYRSSR